MSLKPCGCIDQCRKYLCNGTQPCDTITNIGDERVCFKRKIPRVNAMIDPPDENETGVTYYRYPWDDNRKTEITFKEAIVAPGTRDYSLPLDNCPERCNENGACVREADNPAGTPRCLCHLGYQVGGMHSSIGSLEMTHDKIMYPISSRLLRCRVHHVKYKRIYVPVNALVSQLRDFVIGVILHFSFIRLFKRYFDTTGRGKCVDAFCHCKPPYWGLGCGKDAIFQSDNNTRPNVAEFKIYV